MNEKQLDRALRLVKRTGDKLLVADRDSDEVFAIMNLDDYENLLAGEAVWDEMSEEDMMNKVNRDIASWRSHHQTEDWDDLTKEDDWTAPAEAAPAGEIPPEPDIEPITPEDALITPAEPHSADNSTEEVSLSDVPEEEEEKFYLEPVV